MNLNKFNYHAVCTRILNKYICIIKYPILPKININNKVTTEYFIGFLKETQIRIMEMRKERARSSIRLQWMELNWSENKIQEFLLMWVQDLGAHRWGVHQWAIVPGPQFLHVCNGFMLGLASKVSASFCCSEGLIASICKSWKIPGT